VPSRGEFAGGLIAAATTLHARHRRVRHAPPITSGTAYVTCSETNVVAVVDLPTARVVHYVTVGNSPARIALDRKRRIAFVSNFESNSITAIDLAKLEAITEFDAPNGPTGLAVDETRGLLFFSSILNDTVTALDSTTGRFVSSAIVGPRPTSLAFEPISTHLYAVNSGNGTLSFVDTGRRLIATPLRNGPPGATDIALSADGSTAYVTSSDAGTLSSFDLKTRRTDATIAGLSHPQGVAPAPDPTRVYVAEPGGSSVAAISVPTHAIASRIRMPGKPTIIRANAAGDRVFAIDFEAGSLCIAETRHGSVLVMVDGLDKPRDFVLEA
jgi:DNA-binding beta-propeller fold protein YncE